MIDANTLVRGIRFLLDCLFVGLMLGIFSLSLSRRHSSRHLW